MKYVWVVLGWDYDDGNFVDSVWSMKNKRRAGTRMRKIDGTAYRCRIDPSDVLETWVEYIPKKKKLVKK